MRGLDHVGITVDDMDAAGRFLEEGLRAELIFEALRPSDPPYEGVAFEQALDLPPGAKLHAIRMYRVGTGPGIELFHYSADDRRPAIRACDRGLQHFAVYADDLDACVDRLIAAGATRLGDPWPLAGPEGGEGNRFCFVLAPFGALIEVVTYPNAQPYELVTPIRRWKPPLSSSAR
jgi:catechol 2,3-dioxygenase-like lactoylglutathione lyase family enzyme